MFALFFAASAQAVRPRNCGTLQPRAELRCAKHQLRQAKHEAAAPIASPPHSLGYWRWRVRVAHRWIKDAKRQLERPPIRFLALWTCIHDGEGSWNNADTGHNGHYGGLQMTSPWGRGDYYVYRADWLSPYEQMRKAELGFQASGYSRSWLYGQWAHPECMGYA